MHAVKAIYDKGKIDLLSPLTGVDHAELCIIVLDDSEQSLAFKKLMNQPSGSEEKFFAAGLNAFFDTEDDANIDWEEALDVKVR
jgi:hypothetical protein